jgi:GNAT superfamily N-acetyltransferase
MNIVRTNNSNPDFKELCIQLDSELNSRYGKYQFKYDKHNVIEDNQTVIVGYIDGIPVASGCFKALDKEAIEIKRMYVKPEYRRKGLSTFILTSLENWAEELGFSIALLETGKGQPEAINLYKKNGYEITENYELYAGIENSICMKKKIKKL